MRLLIFIVLLILLGKVVYAGNLISSATWTESGDFKMAQQDQYPLGFSTSTISRIWDGTTISLFGGKGELLTWVTYLNAGSADATNVTVVLSSFTGVGQAAGSGFAAVVVSSMNVWDYTTRPYSLYKYGYLQIIGSHNSSGAWDPTEYDEGQLPNRWRVPCVLNGNNQCPPTGATQAWNNRRDHDKFYPDIALPMELFSISSFTVVASSSQAIGGEVYISTALPAGTYTASLTVKEGVTVSTTIPISLLVYNVILPATASIPIIAYEGLGDLALRYHGNRFPASYFAEPYLTTELRSAAFLHRHKIIPIGDQPASTQQYPSAAYVKHIDGSAYKETYGLAYNTGPGYGTGDSFYMIGTYGSWASSDWSTTVTDGATGFCTNLSSWTYNCVQSGITCKLYTHNDEASDTILAAEVKRESTWASTTTTCASGGNRTGFLQTGNLVAVLSSAPYVNTILSTSWIGPNNVGSSTTWATDEAISTYTIGSYNSGVGSGYLFEHMAQGSDPRVVMWGAWKTNQDLWMAWSINYWNDSNNPGQASNGYNANAQNENDAYRLAKTFGYDTYPTTSTSKSHTGFNFNNGDGLMLYYGTDPIYTPNYTVNGVFGSWRLNMLTRGIQDADLMKQAYSINPSSTTAVVNNVISDVMYLRQCFDMSDCTYSYGDRPFTQNGNAYEVAREALEQIIAGAPPSKESIQGNVRIRGNAIFR